jgi:uncharacterized membrane protein
MTLTKVKIFHICLSISIVYILCFFLLSILKYKFFDYYDFDLAVSNQIMWNTLHGNFLYSSLCRDIIFTDHTPFILIPLLGIYAFFPYPVTLLLLQTLALGLTAPFIYLIALDRLKNKRLALIFFLSYLLYPAVGFINLFEFHSEVFAVLFLTLCFYYFKRGSFKGFLIFALLALSCKEDVALATCMFGVYIFIFEKNRKWGVLLTGISVLWFTATAGFIIPYFNKGRYMYLNLYSHLGATLPEMIKNIVWYPFSVFRFAFTGYKLRYLFELFAPLGFLPLLGLPSLSVILLTLARNLLINYDLTTTIHTQYAATMMPFLIISAIYGYGWLEGKFLFIKRYSGILALCILANSLFFNAIIGPQLQIPWQIVDYKFRQPEILRDKFVAMVPKDANVTATFRFLPKLSNRRQLQSFHHVILGRYRILDRKYVLPEEVNYALIDFNDPLTFNVFYSEVLSKNIRDFLKRDSWGIIEISDSIALLKKNYKSPYLFYQRIDKVPAKSSALTVLDGDLKILDHELAANANYKESQKLQMSIYWQRINYINKDCILSVYFQKKDSQSGFFVTLTQRICYGIYPVKFWEKDEIVKCNYWIVIPDCLTRGLYEVGIFVFCDNDKNIFKNKVILGDVQIK